MTRDLAGSVMSDDCKVNGSGWPWRVDEEEMESVDGEAEGLDSLTAEDREVVLEDGEYGPGGWEYVDGGCRVWSDRCCERMVLAIRSSLKGPLRPMSGVGWTIGLLHSSTVVLMAVVISSRLV